tara:strand:- start:25009 stop:28161 length:3153 start_codon:yes stop_codon:yes gene_type:complete
MFNVWSFFTQRSRFAVIVIAAILFLGIGAIYNIPKESAPEVDVPIAIVSTVLPGASPEDVEQLVTNVLEEPLKNTLSDVRNITSTSGNGISTITVEFEANANLPKSMRSVRDEVDAAKIDLPDDALDPRIIEIDFGGDPVVTGTLSADIPNELLYTIAEDTADVLETIPGVSSVVLSGVTGKEVQVVIDTQALQQYGITVAHVTGAIAGANTSLPVGNIEIDGAEFPVRLAGDIESAEHVADTPILSLDGAPVYVRDVANVFVGREEPSSLSRTSLNNQPSNPSVSFEVFKSSSANITTVSTAVQEKLQNMQKEPGGLLENIAVHNMYDSGEELKSDLTTLTRSGMYTVLLVTLVLMIAVGWRESIIAAISIPLSFLTAFIGLAYSGNSLNFVSLFALILSIGIIVDSTIVIVEGINKKLHEMRRHQGETVQEVQSVKSHAALDVVREFHVPLTAGTMTTIAVFAPLFIVSGITGEFIKSIPFTIIFVLAASLLVALGFVPMIATKLLRRGSNAENAFVKKRENVTARFEALYRIYLTKLLSSREAENILFITLIALFVLTLALPVVGAVRVVFFEDSNSDYMILETSLPIGSVLSETDLEIRKAEEVLYTIPEATSFVTTVGSGSAFTNPFEGSPTGSARTANIFVNLDPKRKRNTTEILDDVRQKLEVIKTSDIRADQLSDGPPSLAPITITIYGDKFVDLEIAAAKVETVLKRIPGTADITSSVKDATSEFVFSINRDEVVALGADIRSIAGSLRVALYGEDITEIKQLGDDVDIVARVALDAEGVNRRYDTNITTLESLARVMVQTQSGVYPLATFIEVAVEPSRASIEHDNGTRIATVSSRIGAGGNALVITQQAQKLLASETLPEGVRLSFGGESEDIDQSFRDMFTALIIGVISMFAILVLQFNSFRFATYVLMIVPLSLIGVFLGLMITGNPLSFPSIMGFIALSGIVVNNSIILIDTINTERRTYANSKTMHEIVVNAAASRLRPVLLTALTTVIGVIPLLFAAAIWVPLAYALMFGLAFATIITLVLVPSIYARWPGKDI